MQVKDAERLRNSYGDRPCPHPTFAKEYYLGSHTGEYVCKQCGRTFSTTERDQIESNRR
jgi:hypothetical protein